MGLSRSCFVPGDLTEWPTMLGSGAPAKRQAGRLKAKFLMLVAENNFEMGSRMW